MKITNQLADHAILNALGTRLAKARLDRNLTQAQLAENAGVSKRTVERIEAGESAQLASFIRLCRALDLVDYFEMLVPETPLSPIAQLKARGKSPQRARTERSAHSTTKKWAWGDDE
jgi:transcriptional regulator with XRE-family HTH domain